MLKLFIALNGNPSQSYRASLTISDHTELPAVRNYAITLVSHANIGGMKY